MNRIQVHNPLGNLGLSASVACAATGLVGQDGNIFRFTIGHSFGMVVLMSILTILQTYVLKWMLP